MCYLFHRENLASSYNCSNVEFRVARNGPGDHADLRYVCRQYITGGQGNCFLQLVEDWRMVIFFLTTDDML